MGFLIGLGLLVCNFAALILTALTLPGNWIMVALTIGVAWWRWDDGMIGWIPLILITILAIIGEILETLTASMQVKKQGGSRRGSWGALLGSFVGLLAGSALIPIPILGSLIGTCAGALAGALLMEKSAGKTHAHAWRIGKAAFAGRMMGTLAKLAVGIAIWIIVLIAVLWP